MKKTAKGFTLVELMVAMILLGIVVTLASSVLISSGMLYQKEVSIGVAQSTADGMVDFIADRMRYSKTVSILETMPATPSDYAEIYYFYDGKLYADYYNDDGTHETKFDVFGDDYYNGLSAVLTADISNDRLVDLTIGVYEELTDENPKFSLNQTVDLINMGKAPSSSFDYDNTNFSSTTGVYICLK